MLAFFHKLIVHGLLLVFLFVASPLIASPEDTHQQSVILIWGDSLSAAYGIEVSEAWPSLLQTKLSEEGYDFKVVNGSVSGETTVGGLARLPKALKEFEPKIVLLALGANDGLRGFPPNVIQEHLAQMTALSKAAQAKVLLFEMKIPPNYGPKYTSAFETTFKEVAKQYSVALLPFWLEPIAIEPSWMQADGLHPTAEAQPVLLEQIWQGLSPLLELAAP